VNPAQAWTRAELNNLRKEYREYSQKSLDRCFSYLNLYVGLLAALLAATLTGLPPSPAGRCTRMVASHWTGCGACLGAPGLPDLRRVLSPVC
jgi:hypothetical protein